MNKKLTKMELAKELNITHNAIVFWQNINRIPAEKCMDLEPILKIPARELYLDPNLLFDKFRARKSKKE